MPTKTIAFVHGNFVTKQCWDPWVDRFQARGYNCVAIAYPGRDKPVETLKREHPNPALGRLSMPEVYAHHAKVILSLTEPPILIGHSFGGLLTQLLLQAGLGAAGVAIDSVPPQGVLSPRWSFIRSLWPLLNPMIPSSRPYYMTFPQFQYSFANTLPPEQQRAVYDQQIVPESRRLARGALTTWGRVDYSRRRPPLLLISGSEDHFFPTSLNWANYQRYAQSPSVTSFMVAQGRDHYIIGEPGWEEVADYAVNWASEVQSAAAARPEERAPQEAQVLEPYGVMHR